MRYLFGFLCVCALGVVPLVGCSETAGEGGSGGTGGAPCVGDTDCDDGSECTEDACDSATGACEYMTLEGPCTVDDVAGFCEDGVCCSEGNPMGPSCDPYLAEKFPDQCICEPTRCQIDDDCDDDYNDCTEGLCSDTSRCSQPAVMDGTACAGGTCEAGVCSLTTTVLPCNEQGIRNAVAAGGDEPYTFDCSGPTTVVTLAEIRVYSNVTLDGQGELTLDGNGAHTVFWLPEEAALELRGFGVTNASADGISGGTLTVTNSSVSGHGGAGISGETVTVTNSSVSGNGAAGIRGRTVAVTNSSVSGNTGGGIAVDRGTMSVTQSTVSGNSRNSGGGIWANEASVTVVNSTVSGNSVEFYGSAIFVNGSTLTLANSTVSGDISTYDRNSITNSSTVFRGACTQQNAGAIWTSNGYNIESPGDTCGFDQTGDLVNITEGQLDLGELANNGGPTMTHALGTDSDAIDHIPAVDCGVTTDQRGEPRPETGGTMCDVGSFERQPEDP